MINVIIKLIFCHQTISHFIFGHRDISISLVHVVYHSSILLHKFCHHEIYMFQALIFYPYYITLHSISHHSMYKFLVNVVFLISNFLSKYAKVFLMSLGHEIIHFSIIPHIFFHLPIPSRQNHLSFYF